MSLSKRPVSLEDILRLKRAERPAAEFWEQFDRQLRAKQLAALVEKRPWWRDLSFRFAGFRRFHLPLGATAVLALTFFTVREYQSAGPAEPAAPASAVAVASSPAPVVAAPAIELPQPTEQLTVAEDEAAPAAVADRDESTAFSAAAPLFGVATTSAPKEVTPSARAIAANLAAAQASAPAAARALLTGMHGFETRAIPARAPAEPLAQMTAPSDVRRSRLMSAMATNAAMNDAQVRNTDRVPTRIPEDRLYDEVRRFGARGDRFSVRF